MTKENSVNDIPSMISDVIENLGRIQEVVWGTSYHKDSNQSIRSAMSEVDKAMDCLFEAKNHYIDAEYYTGMEDY